MLSYRLGKSLNLVFHSSKPKNLGKLSSLLRDEGVDMPLDTATRFPPLRLDTQM